MVGKSWLNVADRSIFCTSSGGVGAALRLADALGEGGLEVGAADSVELRCLQGQRTRRGGRTGALRAQQPLGDAFGEAARIGIHVVGEDDDRGMPIG